MNDETIPVLSWDALPELLQRPFCRRMGGDIAVNNPARPDFDNHENVKDAKGRRHHHEEIAGHDCLCMVADES
jgi:hypothetical protein